MESGFDLKAIPVVMLGGGAIGVHDELPKLGFVLDEEGRICDGIVAERDERVEDLALRMRLMVQQHVEGGVALGERTRAQQARIQAVIDDEVVDPGVEVLAEARVEAAICATKGEHRIVALACAGDAHEVDEFVEIDVGEREGTLLDVALARLCTPGEVTTQLLVAHVLVAGVVVRERAGELEVVLVSGEQACLLVEDAGNAHALCVERACELAGLAYGVWHEALELGTRHDDGLVLVDGLAEGGVGAQTLGDLRAKLVNAELLRRAPGHDCLLSHKQMFDSVYNRTRCDSMDIAGGKIGVGAIVGRQ